ncbi:MAG: hypothetical protein Q9217_005754, partial [Psora testacea]
HLNTEAVPPPPPPPPPPPNPFINHKDPEASSLSSNSNVGAINIVLDDEPGDEAKATEVPPPPPPHPARLTLPQTTRSPPPGIGRSESDNRGGRSENFKTGIKGITERLRSNSRGRNTKSPEQINNTPSPYESVPPLYF